MRADETNASYGNDAWDDNIIQRTWDDAVAEYEKYHSVFKSGKDLLKILTKEEIDQIVAAGGATAKDLGLDDETAEMGDAVDGNDEPEDVEEEGEVDEEDYEPAATTGAEANRYQESRTHERTQIQGTANSANTNGANYWDSQAEPSPDSLYAEESEPTVDEVVETAIQSQYWAGYYKGYYDAMRRFGKGDGG